MFTTIEQSQCGLPVCVQKFETDYWALSYKEAVDWIIEQERNQPVERDYKVFNESHHTITQFYLDNTTLYKKHIQVTDKLEEANYIHDNHAIRKSFEIYR